MLGYILKRVLLMIPTLLGIIVVSFLVMKLAPGDPSALKYGGAEQAAAGINAERGTEAAIARFREKFRLDEPLHVQFGFFLKRLATGDLIYFQTETPIWEELLAALRVTILLNAIVFVLIYALSIPTGIWSAAFPHSRTDRFVTIVLFLLYSLPSFWVAELMRLAILSDWWRSIGITPPILPILGLNSANYDSLSVWGRFVDYLRHILMPVACLTYGGLAYISRQMRAGMLEVIRQDYIRTAEAKGASKSRVILVHALRNSLFPIITLLASLLPMLVGGSVIIEYIFNIPGMGKLTYDKILRREYDLVMATLLISSALTLLGILISDILYVLVNPRVSFESER